MKLKPGKCSSSETLHQSLVPSLFQPAQYFQNHAPFIPLARSSCPSEFIFLCPPSGQPSPSKHCPETRRHRPAHTRALLPKSMSARLHNLSGVARTEKQVRGPCWFSFLSPKKVLLGRRKQVTQVCCTSQVEKCGSDWLRANEIHVPSFGFFSLSIAHNTGTFWLLDRLALILNQGCSCSVDMEGTRCESGHCPAWRLVPPCFLSDRGCHLGLLLALVQRGHRR